LQPNLKNGLIKLAKGAPMMVNDWA